MAELVPAEEPARRPFLSPDPEQAWRPGPQRIQREETTGPLWRRFEPGHVVLGVIALVIVVMMILVALLVTGMR